MTGRRGGYKLFVYCRILFDQLEIVSIPVNIWSPVNGGSRWYSWVVMIVPLGSEGSGILVLKFFMVALDIKNCGLPLSKYISFTSLVNSL